MNRVLRKISQRLAGSSPSKTLKPRAVLREYQSFCQVRFVGLMSDIMVIHHIMSMVIHPEQKLSHKKTNPRTPIFSCKFAFSLCKEGLQFLPPLSNYNGFYFYMNCATFKTFMTRIRKKWPIAIPGVVFHPPTLTANNQLSSRVFENQPQPPQMKLHPRSRTQQRARW